MLKILLIVLILLIVAGAYFLGKNQFDYNKQKTQTVAVIDQTASWQKFVGNGYSIKYPPFLTQSTNTYNSIGGMVTVYNFSPTSNSYAISIYSYLDSVNPKLEFNAKVTSDENISIVGQQVRKETGTEFISDVGTLIHVGPIKNKTQNYMLIFSSGSQKANPNDLDLFNQIISTFKFTQ